MNKSHRYFLMVFAIFTFYAVLLSLLVRRYFSPALSSFVEICNSYISYHFFKNSYLGILLLSVVFLAILFFFTRLIFSSLKTKKKLKVLCAKKLRRNPNKLEKVLSKWGIDKRKIVTIESPVDYAFSFGLLNSKVLISTGIIDKLPVKQLESVILHEYYHLTNRHVLLLFAGEIITASLFFFPALNVIIGKMKVSFEDEADNFAIVRQKSEFYLQSALKKANHTRGFEFLPMFTSRVVYKTEKRKIVLSTVFSLLIFSLFLSPIERSGEVVKSGESETCMRNVCREDCWHMSTGDSIEVSEVVSVSLS